jgi:hypothetical protein
LMANSCVDFRGPIPVSVAHNRERSHAVRNTRLSNAATTQVTPARSCAEVSADHPKCCLRTVTITLNRTRATKTQNIRPHASWPRSYRDGFFNLPFIKRSPIPLYRSTSDHCRLHALGHRPFLQHVLAGRLQILHTRFPTQPRVELVRIAKHFVVTVSVRALNVASFSSLIGLLHQSGTKPHRARINSSLPSGAMIVSIVVVGQTLKRGSKLCGAGPSVSRYSLTTCSHVSL